MSEPTRNQPLPGNRSTALLFAAVLACVGGWPVLQGHAPRLWALGGAALFAIAGWLFAARLTPLTRAWMTLGALLHRVVSPVVLGAIYFLIITPVAWGMRAFGRDALSRRLDPQCRSYWVDRIPPGPDPESLRHPY